MNKRIDLSSFAGLSFEVSIRQAPELVRQSAQSLPEHEPTLGQYEELPVEVSKNIKRRPDAATSKSLRRFADQYRRPGSTYNSFIENVKPKTRKEQLWKRPLKTWKWQRANSPVSA